MKARFSSVEAVVRWKRITIHFGEEEAKRFNVVNEQAARRAGTEQQRLHLYEEGLELQRSVPNVKLQGNLFNKINILSVMLHFAFKCSLP